MSTGLYRTDWSLETSEETSYSAFASVSMGKLHFIHDRTGERFRVRYRCFSAGHGKGPPVGMSWSKTSDPSGDVDNVIQIAGRRTFGWSAFSCYGYMMSLGASAGVVGSIMKMDVTGGGLTIAWFGFPTPFAAVKMWGFGRGALPGLGLSGGMAGFSLEL